MKARIPLTRERILRTLKKNQQAFAKKYSVKRIGLFGSYARGKQTRGSDLDFLVEFDKPTYDNFSRLIAELERLFGKKVEILTPDGVDSIRVEEVARSIRESVVYV